MSVALLILSAQSECHCPHVDDFTTYEIKLPVDCEWLDICYGDGLWILVPKTGTTGFMSQTGTIWTEINIPEDCSCIRWSNGHFLLGTNSGQMHFGVVIKFSTYKTVYWSPAITVQPNERITSIINGFGSHMMSTTSLDFDSGTTLQSQDSSTWHALWKNPTEIYSYNWMDIKFFKQKYILSSLNGTLAYTKSNVNNTVSIVLNTDDYSSMQPSQILINDLATEALCMGNSYDVLVSSDGVNWDYGPQIPIDDAIVAHGDGCYLAMSKNTSGTDIFYIHDIWNDYNWSSATTTCVSHGIAGIAYGQDKFIAVPHSGDHVIVIPRQMLV